MQRAFRRDTGFGVINRFYVVEIKGLQVAIPAIIAFELIQAIVNTIGVDCNRIRIVYGDTTTGETDWTSDFKHDNGRADLRCGEDLREGYVSISQDSITLRGADGPFENIDARYLILTFRNDSRRGSFIRWENVVKVEYSNKIYGGTIWQHPYFNSDGNCSNEHVERHETLMKL